MNRISSPARWATIGLLAATLALAGCGRKGALDLPPQASSLAPTSTAPAVDAEAEAAASKGSVYDPSYGAERSGPVAARGRKKPFILDPILD